jgi:hypothetical protein
MFSRCIVTNITSARGTLHCSKTRIPCKINLLSADCVSHNLHFALKQQLTDVRTLLQDDEGSCLEERGQYSSLTTLLPLPAKLFLTCWKTNISRGREKKLSSAGSIRVYM